MRPPAMATVAGLLLVASTVVGCTSDPGDGDPATPTQGGPSSPDGGQGNVPKVTNPLDPAPFLSDPCKLVDDSIIAEIGDFQPGEADVSSDAARNLIGPSCSWNNDDYSQLISVIIDTVHQKHAEAGFKGLDGVYASHKEGRYLEPVVIEGYPGNPAAFAGEIAKRDNGDCGLKVGIADDLVFDVSVLDENNPANACPVIPKVAGAVLDSLTKGA